MSDVVEERPAATPEAPVVRRLSFLDRWLPLWILAAMALGRTYVARSSRTRP